MSADLTVDLSTDISAEEALQRLKDGNRRYREGGSVAEGDNARARGLQRGELREMLAEEGQQPFAVVLGCSDSRVPVETLFAQGLGDLFVVRVAGNIAGPSQVASIEFAAQAFGSRLVLVLGHSLCGAVRATLEEVVKTGGVGLNTKAAQTAQAAQTTQEPSSMESILGMIRPAVADLVADGRDVSACIGEAVRANVRASVQTLNRSDVLSQLRREVGLRIVGAEYCLKSGVVTFFD